MCKFCLVLSRNNTSLVHLSTGKSLLKPASFMVTKRMASSHSHEDEEARLPKIPEDDGRFPSKQNRETYIQNLGDLNLRFFEKVSLGKSQKQKLVYDEEDNIMRHAEDRRVYIGNPQQGPEIDGNVQYKRTRVPYVEDLEDNKKIFKT